MQINRTIMNNMQCSSSQI